MEELIWSNGEKYEKSLKSDNPNLQKIQQTPPPRLKPYVLSRCLAASFPRYLVWILVAARFSISWIFLMGIFSLWIPTFASWRATKASACSSAFWRRLPSRSNRSLWTLQWERFLAVAVWPSTVRAHATLYDVCVRVRREGGARRTYLYKNAVDGNEGEAWCVSGWTRGVWCGTEIVRA